MTITPATHAISINPATGEQLSVLPWAGANDIENALQLAAAGFRDWRETNIDYRAEKLRGIGKALRNLRWWKISRQLLSIDRWGRFWRLCRGTFRYGR